MPVGSVKSMRSISFSGSAPDDNLPKALENFGCVGTQADGRLPVPAASDISECFATASPRKTIHLIGTVAEGTSKHIVHPI